MMPETLGLCTRSSGRTPAPSNSGVAPANRTRFCEIKTRRGLRSDWRTHFCDSTRRNGYGIRAIEHCSASRARAYPFLRSKEGANRTRFCATGSRRNVPISARRHTAPTEQSEPVSAGESVWRRTYFCAAVRRNGYALLAVNGDKPLADKGFYSQKQVRWYQSQARARRQTTQPRPSFSDESSESTNWRRALGATPPGTVRQSPRRNGYARNPRKRDEAGTRFSADVEMKRSHSIRPIQTPADLGTHGSRPTGLVHAETGTL